MLRFVNARVLRDGALENEDLWVDTRTGRVVDPMRRFYEASSSRELEVETRVDCHGGIVAPGFIDAQFNGGFGIDFSSVEQMRERENVRKCCRELVRTGVTAFCPTLISCKPHEYREILANLDAFMNDPEEQNHGARIVGLHLEGPFFNREKIGAHPLENIVSPKDSRGIEDTYQNELSHVKLVTLAPEQPGALDIIRELRKRGIVVSIGHSAATLDQADAGVGAGASMITHMFNAMGAFHHRDPGIIGLLGRHQLHDRVSFGVICDGLHVNPASVAIAYQSHPKGAVLVTDAMAGMGLPCGSHALGSQEVEISWAQQPRAGPATAAIKEAESSAADANGSNSKETGKEKGNDNLEEQEEEESHSEPPKRSSSSSSSQQRQQLPSLSRSVPERRRSKKAVLRGTQTLAGSVVSMEECVQNFRIFTGCSIAEALEAASVHPARVLELPAGQGNLRFGSEADFVILHPETLRVQATYRAGVCLYSYSGHASVS